MNNRLTRVSRTVRQAVLNTLQIMFDPNPIIDCFVSSLKLRRLQARMRFLIGGIIPYSVIRYGSPCKAEEMEIYAHAHDIPELCEFFALEGFLLDGYQTCTHVVDIVRTVRSDLRRRRTASPTFFQSWDFHRKTGSRIRLFAATYNPLLIVLHKKYSMLPFEI